MMYFLILAIVGVILAVVLFSGSKEPCKCSSPAVGATASRAGPKMTPPAIVPLRATGNAAVVRPSVLNTVRV